MGGTGSHASVWAPQAFLLHLPARSWVLGPMSPQLHEPAPGSSNPLALPPCRGLTHTPRAAAMPAAWFGVGGGQLGELWGGPGDPIRRRKDAGCEAHSQTRYQLSHRLTFLSRHRERDCRARGVGGVAYGKS